MWQVWIGIIGVLIMAGGLGSVFYLIHKQQATIGNRTIAYLAISMILPLAVVLGVMNVLGRETIGPLLGVILGYVLSKMDKE